jgi:purine-binding chemotaxis protein CheW
VSEHTTEQIVIFALAGEEYALPITNVHEIIRYTRPRTVSGGDASVLGVISLRGRILPVIDVAVRLGRTSEPTDRAKIVIVNTAGGTTGVIVDDVEEVHTLDAGQIEDASIGGEDSERIVRIGDRLVVLLDERLLCADPTTSA